jgi:hypothetical protein
LAVWHSALCHWNLTIGRGQLHSVWVVLFGVRYGLINVLGNWTLVILRELTLQFEVLTSIPSDWVEKFYSKQKRLKSTSVEPGAQKNYVLTENSIDDMTYFESKALWIRGVNRVHNQVRNYIWTLSFVYKIFFLFKLRIIEAIQKRMEEIQLERKAVANGTSAEKPIENKIE